MILRNIPLNLILFNQYQIRLS